MMKKHNFILFCFLVIACSSPEVKETSFSLNFFDRLPGKWQLDKSTTIEQWEKDGELYKATVSKPLGKEWLVIERIRLIKREGEIFYEAAVRGQNKEKPVPFRLIESGNDKVVFENKTHDFPQKITYQFISDDRLLATIEGMMNGKTEKIDFKYSRIRAAQND
jgi:hypothetical protein